MDIGVGYFGGLGNQLFQLNFAIRLAKFYKRKVALIKHDFNPRSDRAYELEKLVLKTNNLSDFVFVHPETSTSLLSSGNWQLKFEKKEFQPFQSEKIDGSSNVCFIGHYQHHRLVKANKEVIITSLLDFTSRIQFRKIELNFKEDFAAIHVRRGDLLEKRCEGMGLVSPRSFESIIRSIPSFWNRYVFTDDLQNGSEATATMEISRILGPEDTNIWESFSLMANASHKPII